MGIGWTIIWLAAVLVTLGTAKRLRNSTAGKITASENGIPPEIYELTDPKFLFKDTPTPPKLQAEPVIFEPIQYAMLSRSSYELTNFLDLRPYAQTFENFAQFVDNFTDDLLGFTARTLSHELTVGSSFDKHLPLGAYKEIAQIIRFYTTTRLVRTLALMTGPDPKPPERHIMIVVRSTMRQIKIKVALWAKNEPSTYQGTTNMKQWATEMLPKIEEFLQTSDRNLDRVSDEFASRSHTFKKDYMHLHRQRRIIKSTYQTFLGAIDQLKYHPSETGESPEREKRSVPNGEVPMEPKITERNVEVVEKILKAIEKHDPKVHKKLVRNKRFIFGIAAGILAYKNSRSISKIREHMEKLQEQNELQEKQIIELTHFLNLTMVQVSKHQQLITKLQIEMVEVQYKLYALEASLNKFKQFVLHMTQVKHTLGLITTGIIGLQRSVEGIYEYLRVISLGRTNPIVMPPGELRNVLKKVKNDIRQNARLRLPYDPEQDIFSFYNIMRVTPIIMDNFLIVVLSIPLMDISLKMKIFRVHNLPALHPKDNIEFTYELEGKYLAISEHGEYAALPDEHSITMCLTTRGGMCRMDQALYPTNHVEWCVYALYKQDKKKIRKHCRLNTKVRYADRAINLYGYMWAVSVLRKGQMQVRCLTKTSIVKLKPPLQIVHIGDGCEGYTPHLTIPATSSISGTYDFLKRNQFLMEWNEPYQDIKSYTLFDEIKLDQATLDQIEKIKQQADTFGPMNIDSLREKINTIDDIGYWDPSGTILFIVIVVLAIIILGVLAFLFWRVYWARRHIRAVKPMVKLMHGGASQRNLQVNTDRILDLLEAGRLPQSPQRSPTIEAKPSTSQPPPLPQPREEPKKKSPAVASKPATDSAKVATTGAKQPFATIIPSVHQMPSLETEASRQREKKLQELQESKQQIQRAMKEARGKTTATSSMKLDNKK